MPTPPTATLDVPSIRTRFPALQAAPTTVHACAPGGTQMVDASLDAMRDAAIRLNANQHAPFATSRAVDTAYDRARTTFGRLLGSQPQSIAFGPNMTTLAFHLAHALDEVLATGGEVVCTRLDHDANVAPWLGLAERTGATVRWIDIADDTTLLTDQLDEVITERTRLVAFPLASNAFGTLVDPAPIVEAARRVGALTIMDAVHAAPHVPVDRTAMGLDVVFCSPYKFFGPHAGVMAADPALLERLSPDKVRPSPDTGPERWQTGTASVESVMAAEAAAAYLLDDVGLDAVVSHERGLSTRMLDGLADLPRITLHGVTDPARRTPTFAVTHATAAPAEVAEHLAAAGINTYAGHYYAIEPMRAAGLLDDGGATRIGLVHYHGDEDVDRVLAALASIPTG